ncbi:hypothetical protein FQN54_007048 [Arachnomyces sp. PD_36]|nr:hypothetical protein FQN54_007048 [Arachnomyces sp. PD_36]
MLARLKKLFATPSFPSALLAIGNFNTSIQILHIIPEDGTIERFGVSNLASATRIFRPSEATEQTREQIGTVTLYVGDGESEFKFLDDIETRTRKLWSDCLNSSPSLMQTGSADVTQLVQDVLQPAALDAIRAKEGRDRSMNATQTYSVFVLRVNRSKPGRIRIDKMRSIQ